MSNSNYTNNFNDGDHLRPINLPGIDIIDIDVNDNIRDYVTYVAFGNDNAVPRRNFDDKKKARNRKYSKHLFFVYNFYIFLIRII